MQTFWKNVEDMSLSFLLKYFENGPYIYIYIYIYILLIKMYNTNTNYVLSVNKLFI